MRSIRPSLVRAALAVVAIAAALPWAAPGGTRAQDQDLPTLDRIVASLSVDERIGQLVMVNFVGDDVSPEADIAGLIRDYNVGAVLVTASNGNIINRDDTAAQLAALSNGLQDRAAESTARDGYVVPLFIATDNEGDLFPFTNVTHDYTQIPNNMAIGATFDKTHAKAAGDVVGRELSAAGINLLLGPVVDVLDSPRSGGDGDIGIRSFGGNPAWAGALARAYIAGVHEGSGGRMLTVAKHFPGHGGSDRATDNEVPTVNKTLDQLRATELAPFAAVAREDADDPLGTTDAMMVSHIRYRNFLQGGSDRFTRPISLDAAAFRALMDGEGFAEWHADHMVMADALGVEAVKAWYRDTEGQAVFPHRTVVREALLAGNDLLPLVGFYADPARPGWQENQLPLMQDAIVYMREQYAADSEFRRRADEAVRKVIAAKMTLYPQMLAGDAQVDPAQATAVAGGGREAMSALADAALTLIEPASVSALRTRFPRGPQSPEKVLIVECWSDCYPYRVMTQLEMQNQLLAAYGPNGAGRLQPEDVATISFGDLDAWLSAPSAAENAATAQAFGDADWIVFVLTEYVPQFRPASGAVKRFLDATPIDLRNKNLVAIAYNVPYHLDSTEISKLGAYFAVYQKTDYAIATGFRALFGEIEPRGRSPVNISGVFYNVAEATQPDPSQDVALSVFGFDADEVPAGDAVALVAGPVRDRNGNPVADGTMVSFALTKEAGATVTARVATVDGLASAQLPLDGAGSYAATASIGTLTATPLAMRVRGDAATPAAVPSPAAAGDGDGGIGNVTLAVALGVPATIGVIVLIGAVVFFARRRSRAGAVVPALATATAGPLGSAVVMEPHAASAAPPLALRVDAETRRVYVKGVEARPPLSNEQFRLLSYLYERAGKVVPREELVRHVWPDAHLEGVSEEALDALVRRVRDRIVQAGGERAYLVTLRGQGFRLEV